MSKPAAQEIQPTVQAAEQLLTAGRFADALSLVSSLQAEDQREQCRLDLIASEARLYLGQSDCDSLYRVIDLLRPSQENDLYARAKLLLGWALLREGRPSEAAQYLRESSVYFRRYDQTSDLRRCLALLAQIAFQSMNLTQVEEYTCELVALSEGTPYTADLYRANLARAYSLAGRLTEAERILEECSGSLRQFSTASRANFHLSMSLLHTLRGKYSEGRAHLKEIAATVSTAAPREAVIFLEYSGILEMSAGNIERARTCLRKALSIISIDSGDESSQVNRLLADFHVMMGEWRMADQHAREALAVAEKITERVEIAACYRIFAQIEHHKGNHQQARDWFEQANGLFNQIGSRYELAVTRYLYAASGLLVNGERSALLHLARQYFVSEDITHYLERVDRAITAAPTPSAPRAARDNSVPPVIISQSKTMQDLLTFGERVAQSERPILLTGETGTGKDLFARFIHYHSGRSGEFIPVNAAAIPDSIVEAELFGHTRGAFTGAATDRIGLIEQAADGTLYLDEIADASPELQAKLLQVLESKQVRPLGQNQLRPISCRIIAATNHDLKSCIRDNRFRPDLFHRLNHIPIELPPLRERGRDLPLLIEHFLMQEGVAPRANGGAEDFERLCLLLSARSWLGNVRELQTEIHRLHMSAQGNLSRMPDLALECEGRSDRDLLASALSASGGNKSRAARLLGVSEAAVRKRMLKHGLK